MIKITWKFKHRFDNAQKSLKNLDGAQVRVGYFADTGDHPTAKMSFATLMAIHELRESGDPMHRPVFGKAVEVNGKSFQNLIHAELGTAIEAGARGATTDLNLTMTSIGQHGIKMIKPIFGSTYLRRNKDSTIKQKGFNAPMVEDGSLRDALTFKVKL